MTTYNKQPNIAKREHNVKVANLALDQLKKLSTSLYHFFRSMDNPPADEMLVPISQIRPHHKESNTYFANITYVVNYCGKKENTVRVKFKVDDNANLVKQGWHYVPMPPTR